VTTAHDAGHGERDPLGTLKTCFGYEAFRPGQREVIDAILAGQNVLAVMPTGTGKSLCYQIPALILEGLTVVISPLISLMNDQIKALRESGVAAACLNSSLSPEEYRSAVDDAISGACRILYVAPERLGKEETRRITLSRPIPLVVVDEAHCVSHWGHDFRPSYLQIRDFIAGLPGGPLTAAFTATATGRVREDIIASLGMGDPFCVTTGFDRPNLYFAVERPRDKLAALVKFLDSRKDKSGIVYCSARRTVEDVAAALAARGFPAARYHAGLEDGERRINQEDFINDRKSVMVATNAFGMGIDKSNVAFVVHYNMPKNIESYYQEAGRAGRDGSPAECVLFYSPQDVHTNRFLIERSGDGADAPDQEQIARQLELLKLMTFYSTGTDCLRAHILRYFGENPPGYCGNCSHCLTNYKARDITVEAQKILSCVYRLHQRGRSVGKTAIINILRGSEEKRIFDNRWNTLSTYGIMKDTSAHQARLIMDYLVEQGFLAVAEGEFPTVGLTAKAREIIAGKRPLSMMLPEGPAPAPPVQAAAEVPVDEGLLARLKALRRRFAQEAHVPAYIIFSDATLTDMCRKRPATPEAFRHVNGVGDVKLEKYGAAFIECIQADSAPP
jgi:ATP-dependent DNA helicase RecQ